MCGICGWFGREDVPTARRMVEAIRHRGPDGDGVAVLGGHTLGAARLEIFGGVDGDQPWLGKGLGVVFNGEIYNYDELRRDLEAQGHVFLGDAEAELIALLYLAHGGEFASKLRGMFAIAVVDPTKDRLTLARDPFGIKPLYYVRLGRTVAFASEIKALLQIDAFSPVLDEEALEGLMTFGYVFQSDRTLFRHISQVRPGHVLAFADGVICETAYFELPDVSRNPKAAMNGDLARLSEQVRNSMRRSLAAHVGHGTDGKAFYLSGGVDSSFMASLAAQDSGGKIVTYTLAADESSEDLLYARKVANAIGSDHREINVDLARYLTCLPDYVHHFEHVVAGGVFDVHGGVAFHILSAEIAKDFKVAFSGEGADELFGGYYWTYTHPLGFADRLRKRRESVGANGSVSKALDDLFPMPEDAWGYRVNLLDWLMRSGLSNYHLCSVDRSAGAFGFEIRPIYLDTDFASEALKIPAEYKLGIDGKLTKYVLREAARPVFQSLGIGDVLTRQKLGMPWAVEHLSSDIRLWAEGRISDRHLDSHPYRKFLDGKLETLFFDLFHHIFFESRGHLAGGFNLEDFLASADYEHMYS